MTWSQVGQSFAVAYTVIGPEAYITKILGSQLVNSARTPLYKDAKTIVNDLGINLADIKPAQPKPEPKSAVGKINIKV